MSYYLEVPQKKTFATKCQEKMKLIKLDFKSILLIYKKIEY